MGLASAAASFASKRSFSLALQLFVQLLAAMTERRIDPEDGVAYTWEEFSEYYAGKYKKKVIASYWEECEIKKGKKKAKAPAAPAPKPKAKAKAKVKAEKKAEPPAPKAKAKAKVKAKAKAKDAPEAKSAGNFKVCVCGGSGGIGQPLSMLMALDPNVKELCVFDVSVAMVPPAGVAADLGHLERKSDVKGYVMEVGSKPIDNLKECLEGCHLVLVPAGMPRKPGMTRDDLFKVNADIAKGIVEACAKYCPDAMLGMVVNPVNSIVPAMAELYKKKGLDPLKIVGITTLDVVRANKFVGEITGKNPNYISVPVVGGHAGVTILPLFSQDKAPFCGVSPALRRTKGSRRSWPLGLARLAAAVWLAGLALTFTPGPSSGSPQSPRTLRHAERGVVSGIQGEDKFDGILDEIAAAAEAEDREFAMNQGIGLLLESMELLLGERHGRSLHVTAFTREDEARGPAEEPEEDSWAWIKESFGWLLVVDVFTLIALSGWLIVGQTVKWLFNYTPLLDKFLDLWDPWIQSLLGIFFAARLSASVFQWLANGVAKTIDAGKIPDLDKHVQDAGTDVVNAKAGKGSATLSMAYAGARLGKSILAGLMGKKRTECAYVKSDITDLPYFASKVQFGEKGVTKVFPLGELNEYEKTRLEEVKKQLKTEIDSGLKYAEASITAACVAEASGEQLGRVRPQTCATLPFEGRVPPPSWFTWLRSTRRTLRYVLN
eukprot:s3720_g7.t2